MRLYSAGKVGDIDHETPHKRLPRRRVFPFQGGEEFFFSSRRRHTRWNCDWSSDVCSSDLAVRIGRALERELRRLVLGDPGGGDAYLVDRLRRHLARGGCGGQSRAAALADLERAEERRGGEE